MVTDKDSMESAREPVLLLTASALTLGRCCHLQFETKQLGRPGDGVCCAQVCADFLLSRSRSRPCKGHTLLRTMTVK